MESQEMVNYYKALVWSNYSKKDSTNLTAAHELSHMWFGNSASPLDYRDAWLNESWATHSESLWREHLGNFLSYLSEQEKKMNLYFNNIVKLEGTVPLYDYPRTSAVTNYPTTIYYKGAVVVGMLRHKLGDSVFFRGMQAFVKKYSYSNLTTNNLQTVFEQISSQNLDQFFNQWVYSPGWPKVKATLVYKDVQNSEYVTDFLKLEQIKTDGWGFDKSGYFLDFPIEVTFKRKDGTQRDTVLWMNGDIKQLPLNNEMVYSLQINKGGTLRTLLQVTSINYEKDVSVEDNELSNNVNSFLYNRLLNLTLKYAGTYTVKFYNLYGSEVMSNTYSGCEDLQIDLNNLVAGFYNYVVISEGRIIYKNKLILN
jgi:aminopeptidase N